MVAPPCRRPSAASARYSFGTTRIVRRAARADDDQPLTIDRLSRRSGSRRSRGAIARDTRDDVLDPQRGTLRERGGDARGARARRPRSASPRPSCRGSVPAPAGRQPSSSRRRRAARPCRRASARVVDSDRTRTASRSPVHGRGPARERAFLRRRRHHDPRLRARHGRRAEDHQRRPVSRGRQRAC